VTRPLVVVGPHGRIEVSGDALDAIVAGALDRVEGVVPTRGRKGLTVVAEPGRVEVAAHLVLAAGVVLPDVAEQAQRAIADALRTSLGASARIDVVIEGVEP
jgi:uncharacterized alkaline shock family protein YloU